MALEQRKGESDSEYEARKKRVKRTRQGVDYGLARAHGGGTGSGGGSIAPTNCWEPLIQLTNGWYGNDDAQGEGVINPNITSAGKHIYAMKFDTISGDWIIQLGVAGNEQADNVDEIVLAFSAGNVLLAWNGVNLRYEGNNQELAVALIEDVGTDVCIGAVAVPEMVIHYTFETLGIVEEVGMFTSIYNKLLTWVRNF